MKTELRCLRSIKSNPFVTVSLDSASLSRLDAVSKHYGELTDKRVTRSVIMRRALQMLADHLKGVDTAAKGEREVNALLVVR